MKYDLNPGIRHEVVPFPGTSGSGAEVDDGRLLYVWQELVSGTYELHRAWVGSVDELVSHEHPTMVDDAVIIDGLAGSTSVSMVDGRPVLFVWHKPDPYGSSTAATSYAPAVGSGITALESLDDGETWSALGGASSLGNPAPTIGLGLYQDPGLMISTPAGLLIPAAVSGNYFGDGLPQPALWSSTDDGATWGVGHSADGGPFSGQWSRDVAIDPDGGLWWETVGGGTSQYAHFHFSADDGATWSDMGTASGPPVTADLTLAYDGDRPWAYAPNGTLMAATPDPDGIWATVMDKIVGYPQAEIGPVMLVGVSRNRTIGFGRRWVDLLAATRGWQINRLRLAGGAGGGDDPI